MLEFTLTWGGGEIEDVLVTTSGVADVEGVAAYWQAIVDDGRLRPGLRILIDHRATSWTRMSTPDIEARARAFGGNLLERAQAAAVAAVMGSNVDFGLMRMLHSNIAHESQLELGVFKTIDEARAWLAQQRAGADVALLSPSDLSETASSSH